MTNYNFVNILMKVSYFIEISKHDNSKKAKIKPYQQLIQKLIYLLYKTRPNIAFIVGQLSKHNSDPKTGHIKIAKKVVHYLKNIMHWGLVYRAQTKNKEETKIPIAFFLFKHIRYKNNNYARDLEDKMKLIIEYHYFINKVIVFQCNKKQKTVSISTSRPNILHFAI